MRRLRLGDLPPAQSAALRAVAGSLGGGPAYLVGGAVRDALLGASFDDLDVAVPAGARALARRVAGRAGGAYVELDAERGAGRAVLRLGGRTVHVDVADFRAPTLAEDLAGRDFGVNALAVPVAELIGAGSGRVLDPCGGLADLRERRLRLPRGDAVAADPLRALRGVRLETRLGLRLDAAAARAIRTGAARLSAVSAERVAQEVLEILRLPDSAAAWRRAARLGVLSAVIPETERMRDVRQPEPHRFDVLEHSLRAAAGADRLVGRLAALAPYGDLLAAHLAEGLGGGWTRRETLKLAALLHDVAKPETRAVVDGRVRFFGHDVLGAGRVRAIGLRLRLPGGVVGVLESLVRQHLRLLHLEQAGEVTRRAGYRFFRDLGNSARDLLLLTLVDAAAVTGASPVAVWRRSRLARDLMAGWREEAAVRAVPALLRGEDVMAEFGLSPGPEVGHLLALAREAQHLGLVATREQTLTYLRAMRERERLSADQPSMV